MKNKLFQVFVLAIIAMSFSAAVFSQEEKVAPETAIRWHSLNRTVNITRSGVYRLEDDVRVQNGDGIVITASNVTLNLNGHSVSTRAEGTGRGVVVSGASGVSVRNGKIGSFNANVMVSDSSNVVVENLQITGEGLAPVGGPTEMGILIVNGRAVAVNKNVISSVNLGIFVRGAASTGNRIFENVIVGGSTPGNNLLGICYNPATGQGTDGPRGDNIYNNVITRFGYAIAISTGSVYNIFNENNLASFIGGFREPGALTTGGGTNVSEGNLMVTIPSTVLP
ncbi:MAG: hypothetical protein ACKVRN_16260 [Pyrinomonadaceae bacterium]